MIQEGLHDLAWTRVGRVYAVAHPWKQKEEASAERLLYEYPVRWWGNWVVLAFQNQRGDGAGDWLFLHCWDRLHIPGLTHTVVSQKSGEHPSSKLRCKHLNGYLKALGCGIRHIFATLHRIVHPHAD